MSLRLHTGINEYLLKWILSLTVFPISRKRTLIFLLALLTQSKAGNSLSEATYWHERTGNSLTKVGRPINWSLLADMSD